MLLRDLVHHWNEFFFEPELVYTVAVFRIVFSIILIYESIFISCNLKEYLGPAGLVGYSRYRSRSAGKALSLFLYLPPTMTSVYIVMSVHIIALGCMAVGLFTPLSTLTAFITLRSIINRNPGICNGGDNVARIMSFFLIFTASGHCFSLDELLFYRPIDSSRSYLMHVPWAIRLMQIQIAVIYLFNAYSKLKGSTYRDGTAIYYVMKNYNYRRFPLGAILISPPFVQLFTWGALAIEFSIGIFIWIQDLRYVMIFMGFVLHLTIEYMVNVHLFSWYMLASLLLFVNPTDMLHLLNYFFGGSLN